MYLAHKSILQTSEFIVAIFILLGLILDFLIPLESGFNQKLLSIIGLVFLLVAVIILFLAKLEFKKYCQKSDPRCETTHLVTTGIYKISRNPIYLGMMFVAPGASLIINNLWILLANIPIFIVFKYLLVLPEERYLVNKFGDIYREYTEKVRRWF